MPEKLDIRPAYSTSGITHRKSPPSSLLCRGKKLDHNSFQRPQAVNSTTWHDCQRLTVHSSSTLHSKYIRIRDIKPTVPQPTRKNHDPEHTSPWPKQIRPETGVQHHPPPTIVTWAAVLMRPTQHSPQDAHLWGDLKG
uniref:Uncharacterized protein n=1 Tax=Colletotrichum fructicola (strain Nara gc5) TaxID=1213859 RepID=L2FN14_COLFN